MGALVSVVVPVFNGLAHLRELVSTLLAQDYADLEIVFSEGGSSDDSPAFLAVLDDPRIRVMTMPRGTSAAANWTAVTQAATGEFVKLVCQDDLLKPFAISRQVDAMHAEPNAVMAIAQRDIVDAKGAVLYPRRGCAGLRSGVMAGADVIRTCYLRGTNVIGEPLSVMFRRDALLEAMPWDDSNPLVLDLHTYERVAPRGDVIVDKTSIGAFRVSTSSWSTRLAGVQLHQFERWQREYERQQFGGISPVDQMRAKTGVWTQTGLRLAAYRWLAMKGSFRSADDA